MSKSNAVIGTQTVVPAQAGSQRLSRHWIPAFAGMTNAGRAGTPEGVAELVAFLASDASRYITVQVIRIDGGMVP